jgi:hypothetical protein
MRKALTIIAGIIFVFISLAVVASWTLAQNWPGLRASININGNQIVQWTDDDGNRIKIKTQGKVDLNDDWTGIVRVPRGAEMHLEEKAGGVTRRLDVEAGPNGAPAYTWMVDGKTRPFDAQGRQWLQGMLVKMVRGTGYQADRRVAAILKKQGPEGVLAEVSQIPTDYVKRIYLENLLSHPEIGAATVERALRQAGEEIESDYEMRQVLETAAKGKTLPEPVSLAYAEASKSIESDYEMRQALSALLERGDLSPRVLDAALQAVDTVGSDYERRQTLLSAVETGKLQPPSVAAVIRSAEKIGSDYEKSQVLKEIGEKYEISGAVREAYDKATASIGSDYERKRAEEAVAGRAGR